MIVTFASEGDPVIDEEHGLRFIGTDFRSLLSCRSLNKPAVLWKL